MPGTVRSLAGAFSGFAFFPLSPTNLKKHVNKATCDESAVLSVHADGLSSCRCPGIPRRQQSALTSTSLGSEGLASRQHHFSWTPYMTLFFIYLFILFLLVLRTLISPTLPFFIGWCFLISLKTNKYYQVRAGGGSSNPHPSPHRH